MPVITYHQLICTAYHRSMTMTLRLAHSSQVDDGNFEWFSLYDAFACYLAVYFYSLHA